MINNELLRRIATIFDIPLAELPKIFAYNGSNISAQDLDNILKPADSADYRTLTDTEFACFLNGLIIFKRGKKDGPAPVPETALSNNQIFNKVKIALALKAEDVIATLERAGLSLSKYELSAFFRNVNHKHYRDCADDVLSAFLKGLKLNADADK